MARIEQTAVSRRRGAQPGCFTPGSTLSSHVWFRQRQPQPVRDTLRRIKSDTNLPARSSEARWADAVAVSSPTSARQALANIGRAGSGTRRLPFRSASRGNPPALRTARPAVPTQATSLGADGHAPPLHWSTPEAGVQGCRWWLVGCSQNSLTSTNPGHGRRPPTG